MIFENRNNPTVTVAIPTYNESVNIEHILNVLLLTEYPNLVEIFVADGGSTDATQDIVKKVSLAQPKVKTNKQSFKNTICRYKFNFAGMYWRYFSHS